MLLILYQTDFNISIYYTSNPPTVKSKHNPLTKLTFINLKRLTVNVYAEIEQAQMLQYLFQCVLNHWACHWLYLWRNW